MNERREDEKGEGQGQGEGATEEGIMRLSAQYGSRDTSSEGTNQVDDITAQPGIAFTQYLAQTADTVHSIHKS